MRTFTPTSPREKADYSATAQIFKEMEAEEDEHRRELIEEYRRRFGEHIPWIRREDVKGFMHRKPVWMIRSQLYL
jgi:hypothetical protein